MRRPFLLLELAPMNFADRLKQLPSAAHLTSLQVLDAGGHTLHREPKARRVCASACPATLFRYFIDSCQRLFTVPWHHFFFKLGYPWHLTL